jgi:hypothetical protein
MKSKNSLKNDLKKEDFEKDVKSKKGFLNPLKKFIKQKPSNKK